MTVAPDRFVLDFLADPARHSILSGNLVPEARKATLQPGDVSLFHLEEITYEEKAPLKEALENVFGAVRIPGIVCIYLILGDAEGVSFHFGVVKNLVDPEDVPLTITDCGDSVLGASMRGNFRGSRMKPLEATDLRKKLEVLGSMRFNALIEGVPGVNEDNEDIQGVERVMDVMTGETFGIAILSRPLTQEEIRGIEMRLQEACDLLAPFTKKSVQDSTQKTEGTNKGKTISKSDTTGDSYSSATSKTTGTSDTDTEGRTAGTAKGTSNGTTSGDSRSGSNSNTNNSAHEDKTTSRAIGTSTTDGTSITKGTNSSKTMGTSVTEGESDSTTKGSTVSVEFTCRQAQDWIRYIDEVLMPRLDYGRGKGLFVSTAWILSDTRSSLIKLGNGLMSLYAGRKGNRVPLRMKELAPGSPELGLMRNLQMPILAAAESSRNEGTARTVLSQYLEGGRTSAGAWMSAGELSVMACLPLKEVVGLSLREEVEFGLNVPRLSPMTQSIGLGKLVQSGNILPRIDVRLERENLGSHCFITGVTGSGKTTTCQKLLVESDLPFLVLEPAKTEYRNLAARYDDLLVFTLGKDSVAPFRLNPFEFFEHESITSRVDMIKTAMEAAFDMEAAIPQILEAAMYQCYEDFGWNIASNRNSLYPDPFADGVYAFPTLRHLDAAITTIVKEQGFDSRLQNDYIGSIRARLKGLLVGAKGLMLDTPRSVDFRDLLDRRVVMEIEEIKSASEKSLLMGFILTTLTEAIKSRFLKRTASGSSGSGSGPRTQGLRHLTLIEEAHRLLAKYEPGDSMNQKRGVSVFTDMLAEVRKYGEGLLIVDQIPSKLTPEILKNTNTKIVHRIFARDDKEAIGNTIALKDEQKDFLSSLETGRAIVFTQSWPKAVQLQIEKEGGSDPQSSSRPAPAVGSQEACVGAEEVGEDRLRSAILDFYRHSYRRGILTGLQDWPTMPEAADTETCLQFLQEEALSRLYPGAWADSKGIKRLRTEILRLEALFGQGAFVAGFILRKFFREEESLSLATRRAYLEAFLEKCRQEEVSDRTLFSDYDDRLRP